MYVDARTAKSNVVTGSPGQTPDADVLLGRVHQDDFPLTLHVYGTWGARDASLTYYRTDVSAAEAATAAAPVVVKLPFDTWPVTLIDKVGLAIVQSEPYEVQAAPFFTEQDERSTKTTFTARASSGVLRDVGAKISFDVVAPKTGGVAVTVQAGRASLHQTLAGPGVYVVDESGLRLATAEKEAAAGASPPSPPPGTTPPPPPAAPTTTCGSAGQQHYVTNGSWSCLDGTRVDMSSGVCTACGGDGQTYCVIDPRNISGNWRCNDGTRLESSTSTCVACGDVGQTHCFADPRNVSGNWSCKPGLRIDAASGNCVN